MLNIPFKFIKSAFHALDPEDAHSLTISALKTPFHPRFKAINDERLKVTLWDKEFPNPVGLSAGFDKNAEVIAPMLGMGFGFVETGGVTLSPQTGLPRPRIFRDKKNEAVVNRMNFPNVGAKQFKENVEKFRAKDKNNGLVGIQIAMGESQTKAEDDFKPLLEQLGDVADYMVFNVSCPNTPGLLNLEQKDIFIELASELIEHRNKTWGSDNLPLVVKFSPDQSEETQKDLAAACLELNLDGIILTNTTTTRPDHIDPNLKDRPGGLSGKPLKEKSTQAIFNYYKLTEGKIPIIGVGGISSGLDAYEKIKAGASLIQVYSALVYHGPELATQICRDLLTLLEEDGHDHIIKAVGTAH